MADEGCRKLIQAEGGRIHLNDVLISRTLCSIYFTVKVKVSSKSQNSSPSSLSTMALVIFLWEKVLKKSFWNGASHLLLRATSPFSFNIHDANTFSESSGTRPEKWKSWCLEISLGQFWGDFSARLQRDRCGESQALRRSILVLQTGRVKNGVLRTTAVPRRRSKLPVASVFKVSGGYF